MTAAVTLVVTEHASRLSRERQRRYEGVRKQLERAAGRPVRAVHYARVRSLADSSAVVLSGSAAPWALHDRRELDRLGDVVLASESPVLGICAGLQLLATFAGGSVAPMTASGRRPERGYLPVDVLDDSGLLAGLPRRAILFQDHEDEVERLPPGFRVLARTPSCEVQAIADVERGWWGTQFHPERFDEEHPGGERVLRNFFALAAER